MTLKELLDKGHRQLSHPNINGILVAKDGIFELGFNRIYFDIDRNRYYTYDYELTIKDVMSDEWSGIKLTITIDVLES